MEGQLQAIDTAQEFYEIIMLLLLVMVINSQDRPDSVPLVEPMVGSLQNQPIDGFAINVLTNLLVQKDEVIAVTALNDNISGNTDHQELTLQLIAVRQQGDLVPEVDTLQSLVPHPTNPGLKAESPDVQYKVLPTGKSLWKAILTDPWSQL
jgi:hypothetical protein